MKILGLLGETSHQAMLAYTRLIQDEVGHRLRQPGQAAVITLDHRPGELAELGGQRDWAGLRDRLVDGTRRLESAGVEAFVISSSLLHILAADLEKNGGFPCCRRPPTKSSSQGSSARNWRRTSAPAGAWLARRTGPGHPAEPASDRPKGRGTAPVVSQHMKLLRLAPEILSYLAGVRDPAAVVLFSLRKLIRMSALPESGQLGQFREMKDEFESRPGSQVVNRPADDSTTPRSLRRAGSAASKVSGQGQGAEQPSPQSLSADQRTGARVAEAVF